MLAELGAAQVPVIVVVDDVQTRVAMAAL